MTIHPRQLQLLELVRTHHSATVEQLASQLGVTVQTIRRDVQRLADAGLLTRFHGGVQSTPQPANPVTSHTAMSADGNTPLAQRMAERVPDGSAVFLGAGIFAHAIATALLQRPGLRIITNSLDAASVLSRHSSGETLLVGGHLLARERCTAGEAALQFLRQFRADIALISADSVDTDGNLRSSDYRSAQVTQTMASQAGAVWLAVQGRQLGPSALAHIASLSQVQQVFIDAPLPEPWHTQLHTAGGHCTVVAGPEHGAH